MASNIAKWSDLEEHVKRSSCDKIKLLFIKTKKMKLQSYYS